MTINDILWYNFQEGCDAAGLNRAEAQLQAYFLACLPKKRNVTKHQGYGKLRASYGWNDAVGQAQVNFKRGEVKDE